MNNLLKTFVFGSLSLAMGSAFAVPLDYVDLAPGDGIYINDGKIMVSPVNGEYAQVTSGNTVTYHQRLKAGCKGLSNVLLSTTVYAGQVNVSGGTLESTGDMYSSGVAHQHADEIPFKDVVMDVPLNKLGFNPVQVCKDMLQQKINQGSSKMQVMNADQTVIRPMTFSGVAACGKMGSGDPYYGKDSLNQSVTIICKAGAAGPANQIQKKEMAIPAVPVGGNGNVQMGDMPYKLDKADFQPNIPDYVGVCSPNTNPKIRINLQGSGSEQGQVDLRVAAVSNTYGAYPNYFETAGIISNPQNGGSSHLDFYFPLKEMLSQEKYSYMTQPNKTWNHNMRIEARYKNLNEGTWSEYKPFDTAVFKHRCVPGVNPGLGGSGGIKFKSPDQGPSMKLKAQPMGPDPKPALKLKAMPPKPDPKGLMNLKAQPLKPGPVDEVQRAQ